MKWLNDRIDAWKNRPSDGQQLWEALGMSAALYARWVEKPQKWVLGIDEVGYGALAGPLVIGGVLAPADWYHPELKDSKAFKGGTEKAERARAQALADLAAFDRGDPQALYFLHRTTWDDVDRLGVYKALIRAFGELSSAVLATMPPGDVLVVLDGDERIPGLEHVCLPKADSFVPHVSAASIIAKVSRDTEMRHLGKVFPEYNFGQHKGYGSDEHQQALRAHGLCPIHRKSYRMRFLEDASVSSSLAS